MNPPYGQNAQHPNDRAPSFNQYYKPRDDHLALTSM
jgi:hypothetical protein